MAELDQAAQRLQAALDRLEEAVAARAGTGGGDAELQRALKAARKENQQLKKITDTVAARLDGTIAQLKATLDG